MKDKKSKKKANRALGKETQSKSKLMKIVIAVLILCFAGYFIFNNFNSSKSSTKMIDTNNYSAYEFTKNGELTFSNSEGEFLSRIDIEIAADDQKREQGLMFRNKLAEKQGMLFIFNDVTFRSFWMHNTVLPLDMIFVNSDYKIVTILKNATPFDDSQYRSTKPAKYVVEVNAGYSDKFNIKVGDSIYFRAQ